MCVCICMCVYVCVCMYVCIDLGYDSLRTSYDPPSDSVEGIFWSEVSAYIVAKTYKHILTVEASATMGSKVRTTNGLPRRPVLCSPELNGLFAVPPRR